MNDTESSASSSDLVQQVAALQRQVFLLLVALIVVTATIVFFLYYQSRIASKDLEGFRPTAMQTIQGYQKNALAIQNFEKQLVNFGTTHPGFRPILIKYGLVANPAGPTAPPAP